MDSSYIKKIGFFGVGLMGGSLVKALKKEYPDFFICGYARNKRSFDRLIKSDILDEVEMDYKKVVENSDLVVLSLPVNIIIEFLKKISPYLKKGAIVFDLGSSKKEIESAARKYLSKNVYFVPCHPLCGSEKGGVEFSSENLYQDAVCVITSSLKSKAVRTVKELWLKVGAKVFFMDSETHDKVLSKVSHLPHLISFALTKLVPIEYLKYSAGSFNDLTRISNSLPAIWTDILFSNKENILRDLKEFIEVLKEFESLIKKDETEGVFDLIKLVNAKQKNI
ncbi:MAG: prephenate dehydrogenase [Candidatus Omnitrophica bacterium]|nr:prephenate dehydrogenase [Candidatus Omnitrophota bacterium]MCK5287508.1 prephenate dehydrogenase [Candidatus Omnitrophota bacterium]